MRQFDPQSLFMQSQVYRYRQPISKRGVVKFCLRALLTGSVPVRVTTHGLNYEVAFPVDAETNLVEVNCGLDFVIDPNDLHDFMADINGREVV